MSKKPKNKHIQSLLALALGRAEYERTNQDRVLLALAGAAKTSKEGWVSAYRLMEVGGLEYGRRVRELRADKGIPIECRIDPEHKGKTNWWQYRLVQK
jgi:hypothetical protein